MNARTLAAILALALLHAGSAWGGPILATVSRPPSNLVTPLGPQSAKLVQKITTIGCYDARNGMLQDCGFDILITGLTSDPDDIANNGGHTHGPAHPVGKLNIMAPILAGPSDSFTRLQTNFDIFFIAHDIPTVAGKIDTVLNLRVPPGWHTVSPESCDGTLTSWCFFTTIDVAVPGLMNLPNGVPFYRKVRSPDTAHKDAVAFFGTADAIFSIIGIAESYNQLSSNLLSINDMSLHKGGVFDLNKDYEPPHSLHRVGASVDINKTGGDCRANYDLQIAVALIAPAEAGSFFAQRQIPSSGRFLCEPNGNIHIDLDVIPPPPPSPFQ